MSTCKNIVCKLVDSAADSKLKTLKPGESFGVEKPGGEARIYIGHESYEAELDNFFGFNKEIEVQSFKVSKSDLLDYLLNAKNEFKHPKSAYRLNISEFYDDFISLLISIENDVFEIQFKKNINGRRYYLSPFKEGGRRYSEYIRRICLPLYTNYNFIKSIDDNGLVDYYFKPVFAELPEDALKEYDNPDYKECSIPEAEHTPKSSNSSLADEVEYAAKNADDSIKRQFDYLRAMRTKPFLLLAGISGTGKSRIVKQMAFDSCPENGALRSDLTSPGNYCLIEVKPNWHDSTELLGYESKIGGAHYQLTPFVKFLAKAMLYPDVPFFVCLDEMNLAPVEQYFAEFLSVLESRTKIDGHIVSEPLIKPSIFANSEYEKDLKHEIFDVKIKEKDANGIKIYEADLSDDEKTVYDILKEKGLRIPENVIIIGTVNMDETTHQFSRKVIDRAMTIEMNLPEGDPFMDFFANASELEYRTAPISPSLYLATETKASEVVKALSADNAEKTEWLKGEVAKLLTAINAALEGTPFKVAYRVQNELMLYFYQLWLEDKSADWESLLNTAVNQILMMKVLPRVEGDEELLEKPLDRLIDFSQSYPNASKKLAEMKSRLGQSQFTSFWP